MDYLRDSVDLVAAGGHYWLYDLRVHSYPAHHRHCRRADPNYSRAPAFLERDNAKMGEMGRWFEAHGSEFTLCGF